MNENKVINIVEKVLLVLFILSIIPILVLAFYSRPIWDDFSAARYIAASWTKGQYWIPFVYPFLNVIGSYFTWQGTYTAELIFPLMPGAWPIPAYWVTTFLLVGLISLPIIYFWKTVAEVSTPGKGKHGVILAAAILLMIFQYMPDLQEGIFWWDGATYYSIFMGGMFIEWGILIKRLSCKDDWTKKFVRLMALLAFAISGGNFLIALVNTVSLALVTIYLYLMKNMDKFKQMRFVTIIGAIGLVISVAAPGNLVRASGLQGMGAVSSVIHSLYYPLKLFYRWTNIEQIGLAICLIPVLYLIVKESKFEFRYPIIAWIVMYGLYAAQLTPLYAAEGVPVAAPRQEDMFYYTYYMLMVGFLFYLVGWVVKKFDKKSFTAKQLVPVAAVGLVILVAGMVHTGLKTTNSYLVTLDLVEGRAAAYADEYDAIIAEIKNGGDEVEIEDIKTELHSNALKNLELSSDPDFWINAHMAEYYCKSKILLKETK